MLLAVVLLMALPGGEARAQADARGERPLQMQFDAFGLSVGYHLSPTFYLGYTYQPSYSADVFDNRYRTDNERIFGQNGVDDVSYGHGLTQAAELRVSPWPFGLYFALGYLSAKGDSLQVDYDRRLRIIGDSFATTTGLRVNIDERAYGTSAAGLGFNHVFDFGLSLGAGLLVGLERPPNPDIRITYENPAAPIPQENQQRFRDDVADRYVPSRVLFHLAVGYNF